MVCPSKISSSDSFLVMVGGETTGVAKTGIEISEAWVDEVQDVEPMLKRFTEKVSVPLKCQPLYVLRSDPWMKGIMNSPYVQAIANLVVLRGGRAVCPLSLWGIM